MSSQLEVVTAAAVLVDREAFLEVGGFDEHFAVAYGDVDLCLRLRKAGRRVVLCATTELIHHESRTRGADEGVQARALVASEEAALLRARHGWALAADPWLGPWVVPDAGRLRLRAGAGDLDPELRCVRVGPYDFGQSAELVEVRPGEPRALTLVLPADLAPVELHGLVIRGWGVAPGASLEARVGGADGSVCLEPGWAPPGWLGAWVGTGPVVLEAGGELVVQLGARGDRCLVRAVAGTAGMSGLEGAPRRSPLVELWVKPRAGH